MTHPDIITAANAISPVRASVNLNSVKEEAYNFFDGVSKEAQLAALFAAHLLRELGVKVIPVNEG